jgi:ribosomal peptide maturation radical SAM protein 1
LHRRAVPRGRRPDEFPSVGVGRMQNQVRFLYQAPRGRHHTPARKPPASPSQSMPKRGAGTVVQSCARSGAGVLLIQMPFAPVAYPSIGLTLLKGILARDGISAQVLYLNLAFAERIGSHPYLQLAENHPFGIYNQVGEWVFSGSVFKQSRSQVRDYVERILRKPTGLPDRLLSPSSEEFIRATLDARAMADGFLNEWASTVAAHRPMVVGFSSMFQQHLAALALAKRIKDRSPETFIVLGGPNCDDVKGMETVRRFPFVDAAVSGEGEIVFPEIVRRALQRKAIWGLQGVYSQWDPGPLGSEGPPTSAPSLRNLDDLPPLDYQDYFAQLEAYPISLPHKPRILFETSRGCWWGKKSQCTFCNLNGAYMAFRRKSSGHALDELVDLSRRHAGRNIIMTDSILSMDYFQDFIPELAERKLGVVIGWDIRSSLTKEQLHALHQAGVRWILPGIESLSDPVLKLMRKGVSALQNIQILKWGQELGINILWNLLWGFPSEPPEEYARMTDLLPLLSHLRPPLACGPIHLGRSSPLFEQCESLGLAKIAPSPAYRYIYPFEPRALDRLALYFAYDYRWPQDVETYTRPLLDEIFLWYRVHDTSGLWALDRGTSLLIWDQRPIATERLTVLNGVQRILYLACDRVQTVTRLQKIAREQGGKARSRGEVEALLQPLLDRHMMLRQGDRLLSLAVPAVERSLRREVRKAIEAYRGQQEEERLRKAWRSTIRIKELEQEVGVSPEEMKRVRASLL